MHANARKRRSASQTKRQLQEIIRVIRSSQIQGNMESLTDSQVRARQKRTPGKPKQPSTCSRDENKSGKLGRRTLGCERCGFHEKHNRQACSANHARYKECYKQGHFARCCRARNTANHIGEVEVVESCSSDDEHFLGEVTSNEQKPWTADVMVNTHCVTFKLDSCAGFTVLPCNVHCEFSDKPLLIKTSKKLLGPCRYELKCN